MKTETAERIDTLEDAENALKEAIDLIEAAMKGTPEEYRVDAYILPHLRGWIADSVCSSYCSIKDLKATLISDQAEAEGAEIAAEAEANNPAGFYTGK